MRWPHNGPLAAALLAVLPACAAPPRPVAPPPSPAAVEEAVSAVLAAALDADRRLEPADSLWDPEAVVIANGALRYAPPRFAGVEPGGETAITSSRLEVRQSLVWVYLEYRWLSLKDALAREGRATILLTPKAGVSGWKIVHAHSSSAP
jgi:hypothetical protein